VLLWLWLSESGTKLWCAGDAAKSHNGDEGRIQSSKMLEVDEGGTKKNGVEDVGRGEGVVRSRRCVSRSEEMFSICM